MKLRMIVLGCVLALGLGGCREEGPAEKAGRQIDEAAEEMRRESEGALERLGREVDEAAKETKEAAKELERSIE